MRTLLVAFGLFLCAGPLSGADSADAKPPETGGEPTLPDLFGQRDVGDPQAEPAVSAELRTSGSGLKNGDAVTLAITIDLPVGNHTYPQKKDTDIGVPTKITVKDSPGLKAVDKEFRPTTKPITKVDKDGVKEVYFEGSVTWLRKYQVTNAAGVKPPAGTIRFQICTESGCQPPQTEKFTAKVKRRSTSGPAGGQPVDAIPTSSTTAKQKSPRSNGEREPVGSKPDGSKSESAGAHPFSFGLTPKRFGKDQPIHLQFQLNPSNAKPGETVTASITAKMDEGYHAFALTHQGDTGLPVEIKVDRVHGLEPVGKGWRPDKRPKLATGLNDEELQEHFGTVVWKRQFQVDSSAEAGRYGMSGTIRYQICRETNCLIPATIPFSLGDLTTSSDAPEGSNTIDDSPFPGGAADVDAGGLAWFLVLAFLGGLILNVMPCVLPVIAIKVMSFVQQGGESRGRVLQLNAVYSVGVISVFLLLGTLAAGIAFTEEKIGWGGLFQRPEFNLIMACVIFAMGLALLGVFEIPLPGFVGSAAGGHQQEGLGGAFFTGVFATLLATPCTGPFMGPTFAWSLKQPPFVTLLIFGTMGLGMASPYLIFGFFPQAIRFLPKPGAWMVRFKQFAGFALMGTVVFFISFLPGQYVVPLLVMLMGIALGLWMIGNMYDMTSPLKHKRIVQASAAAVSVGLCVFGYSLTQESEHQLPWKEFSTQNLEASLNDDKTVLVDFTADWCLICKQNERIALNRADTLKFVNSNNVVPMLADYTDQSTEIRDWLERFETDGVPLTVIFPANRPDKPIVLRGPYMKSTLLEKLQEAVDTPKPAAGERSPTTPGPNQAALN